MQTRSRIWGWSLVVLTAGPGVLGAELSAQRQKFENEAGWSWQLEPQPAGWQSLATDGLSMRLDELKHELLLLTLAHAGIEKLLQRP